jgi:hypothetical protein
MPTFTDKFISQLEAQLPHFEAVFSRDYSSSLEERLAGRVQANWHEMPSQNVELPGGGVFAIDGSEATRNFSNAAWLIVGQALLIGPNTELPNLELRLVPGNVPSAVVDSYASRLMRWLEIKLALDHIGRFSGGTLILDGSMYSTLPFLLYPLSDLRGQLGCDEDADLPLRLLEAHLDLFDACRKNDVLLLGISKTTQDRVFTKTLMRLPDDVDVITPDQDDQLDESSDLRIPPDAEALLRWTEGPGYTSPVLLGLHSFGRRRETLLSAPDEIAESFHGSTRYPATKVSQIVERLRMAPAIAAFHLRFADGEECVRVDLPAYSIGRTERLVDLSSGLASAEHLEPAIRLLAGCYGGPNVYNAPLYAVDKQVRLSNDLVDGAYLAILRSAVGPALRYNRSARRFL